MSPDLEAGDPQADPLCDTSGCRRQLREVAPFSFR